MLETSDSARDLASFVLPETGALAETGDPARPYVLLDCIHEHAYVRCSLLRPDPAQRARLAEIRDNLIARIAEAETEGRLGEVEGLQVSLAGTEEKLSQLTRGHGQQTAVDLGIATTRSNR